MDMTQQSDPSTPESPGVGYKAVMVAMYGQAFDTFFPFVLVRNHRPFHSNVSQTLVSPGKDSTSVMALDIKLFGLTVSRGRIQLADTKQRRYVLPCRRIGKNGDSHEFLPQEESVRGLGGLPHCEG